MQPAVASNAAITIAGMQLMSDTLSSDADVKDKTSK